MNAKWYIPNMVVVLFFLLLLSGCADSQDNVNMLPDVESQETDLADKDIGMSGEADNSELPVKEGDLNISADKDAVIDNSISEELPEIPIEENGIMEIYSAGGTITVPEDILTAQIAPEEILKGNLIMYDRFRIDSWVFEWFLSDYFDKDNWFSEDGVLMVTREGDTEDAQVIHVEAEGGYATWVSAKDKFEYVDVNFDDIPDLLICTGHHGNQGLLTYYCFLQTEDGFVESPSFTDIPNPSIDAENKLILSQWRNSATSHSWAEYKWRDNVYILHRELCESAVWESGKEVWVWTVNGEEIGRSDELSEAEIEDLLYNANSEWGITGDRWRTLYNNGLTADFSIYGEP